MTVIDSHRVRIGAQIRMYARHDRPDDSDSEVFQRRLVDYARQKVAGENMAADLYLLCGSDCRLRSIAEGTIEAALNLPYIGRLIEPL